MKYCRRLEAYSYPWNLMRLLRGEETAFLLPSLHSAEDLGYSNFLMNLWSTSFTRMIQLGLGIRCTDSCRSPYIPKFRNTEGDMRKSFQLLTTEVENKADSAPAWASWSLGWAWGAGLSCGCGWHFL